MQLAPSDLASPDLPPIAPGVADLPTFGDASAPDAVPSPPTADEQREQDFNAAPFFLNGRELASLAYGTEAFFHEHRAAINAPMWTLFPSNVMNFAADAARVFFLLSHPASHWLRARAASGTQAINNHLKLEEEIMQWAERELSREVDPQLEYLDTIRAMFFRVRRARNVPSASAGGSLGK
jgi:hypothetical protein